MTNFEYFRLHDANAYLYYVSSDESFALEIGDALKKIGIKISKNEPKFAQYPRLKNFKRDFYDDESSLFSKRRVHIVIISNRSFSRFNFIHRIETQDLFKQKNVIILFRDEEAIGVSPKFIRDLAFYNLSSKEKYLSEIDTVIKHCVAIIANDYFDKSIDLPPPEVIPPPVGEAIHFVGHPGEPIDILPPSDPGEKLNDSMSQSEDYNEIKQKAQDLVGLGSNRLGRIRGPLLRFLDLPDAISDVRKNVFWSRVNTLRIFYQDHEACSAGGSPHEPDERRLDPITASLMKDLVETINIFVIGDRGLSELDRLRPGPIERKDPIYQMISTSKIISEAVANPLILTKEARDVLGEQLENSYRMNDTLASRQSGSFGRSSIQNFLSELLRSTYEVVRSITKRMKSEIIGASKVVKEGGYRAVGASIFGGIVTEISGITNVTVNIMQLITKHASELTNYFISLYNNTAVSKIIDAICKIIIGY